MRTHQPSPRWIPALLALTLLGSGCPETPELQGTPDVPHTDADGADDSDGSGDVLADGSSDAPLDTTVDLLTDAQSDETNAELPPPDVPTTPDTPLDEAVTDLPLDGTNDADAELGDVSIGPFCGDGACDEATEDETSCVVDCGGNEATLCMRDRCKTDVETCLAHASCIDIFECLLTCDTEPCAQQCYLASTADQEATGLMSTTIQCGQSQGCFTPCGNGTCGDDEDAQTCPQDCGEDCILTQCPAEVDDCAAVPGCQALVSCWSACESYDCRSACIQQAPVGAIAALGGIEACAQTAGCLPDLSCGDGLCAVDEDPVSCPQDCETGPVCGDGTCDSTEDSTSCPADCPPIASDSCAGQCGNYEQGAPCQCDNDCPQYKDCCLDAFEECALEWCGDGVCTLNETNASCPEECPAECGNSLCETGEDSTSCTEDCPVDVCLDGQCSGDETALTCSQDCLGTCIAASCDTESADCLAETSCNDAMVICAAGCDGQVECAGTCGADLEPGAKALYQQALSCGASAGCFQ